MLLMVNVIEIWLVTLSCGNKSTIDAIVVLIILLCGYEDYQRKNETKMSSSLYLVFEYMEHDLSGLAAVQGFKVTEPQARVVTSCNFYAAACNFGMTNINPSLLQRFSSPFLHLLSSSMDKTVRLWHLSGKSCLKFFSHSDYGCTGLFIQGELPLIQHFCLDLEAHQKCTLHPQIHGYGSLMVLIWFTSLKDVAVANSKPSPRFKLRERTLLIQMQLSPLCPQQAQSIPTETEYMNEGSNLAFPSNNIVDFPSLRKYPIFFWMI